MKFPSYRRKPVSSADVDTHLLDPGFRRGDDFIHLRAGSIVRWLAGASRQPPMRSNEMAGIAVGNSLEIVLMLGLGFPEVAGWNDFGNDLGRPKA